MTGLRDAADRRAFASVTAPEDLVRLCVPSHELAGLSGSDRPELKIVRALANESPPQRLHIYGEAGAGKTSLILRALADVARRETLERPVHPLFVNTGDAPGELGSPQHFMRMILGLIRVNSGVFASVDPIRLLAATAERTTRTPGSATHQLGISPPFVSYQAAITAAFDTATFGRDAASVRNDFQDVLRLVAHAYRPVIIIDDTDHFAASGVNGELDEQAIANLYHHGVRTLAEFDQLDVLVAVQPSFRQVEPLTEVERRFNFDQIEVATLRAEQDELRLSLVLARRLQDAGIETPIDEVIEPPALAQLQAAYFIVNHDLRRVLEFADEAARLAADEGATRVASRHVQRSLERP